MMDDEVYERLRERSCTSKNAYGARTAREVAEKARTRGDHVSAYKCTFSDGVDDRSEAHWHVGHPPSLEGLMQIAAAIRWHHQHVS